MPKKQKEDGSSVGAVPGCVAQQENAPKIQELTKMPPTPTPTFIYKRIRISFSLSLSRMSFIFSSLFYSPVILVHYSCFFLSRQLSRALHGDVTCNFKPSNKKETKTTTTTTTTTKVELEEGMTVEPSCHTLQQCSLTGCGSEILSLVQVGFVVLPWLLVSLFPSLGTSSLLPHTTHSGTATAHETSTVVVSHLAQYQPSL